VDPNAIEGGAVIPGGGKYYNVNEYIGNVYYMLAYAFRSHSLRIDIGGHRDIGSEPFANLHELFAEIIIRGMRRQLKRGLPKGYKSECEELANLRGKIDIQSSIRRQTQVKHRLICEFDEFTEDTQGNRIIKCAITHLLKTSDILNGIDRKRSLKFLHSYLGNVADVHVRYLTKSPQRTGGAEYVMLVNICRFLLGGLLMNTESGHKMLAWLTDKDMHKLYELFLLEYFKRHHPEFTASSSEITWDSEDISSNMPNMQSDVYLSYEGKTLIIDAKFYRRTMADHFGKKIYHSHNLYQIFTYVKNEDKTKSGNVSGMLLYAKTDEAITPDSDSTIGGNKISVKTLDLSGKFEVIRSQLEMIAETFKSSEMVTAA
jgi:5-methylcytosine-specific restriction enzyme subunit McrC